MCHLILLQVCHGFYTPQQTRLNFVHRVVHDPRPSSCAASTSTTDSAEQGQTRRGPTPPPRRTGFGQKLLDFALQTPIWKYVMVPRARANIAKTAEANNVPWTSLKQWIKSKVNEETHPNLMEGMQQQIPEYYQAVAFHAYEEGNLCWDAAWDVEIASCAVGARNFPKYGSKGEDAFRDAFAQGLKEAGAKLPTSKHNVKILDMGSGSGMSTRRLAKQYPQATNIIGMDLSPFFIAIGEKLLDLAPIESFHDNGPWVSTIVPDERIEYQIGDIARTGYDDNTFDVVNLQFVLHELPTLAAYDVIDEAARILKDDGGQFWICEMDYESPYQAEVRANPLIFSLIRSTEPFLDEYAESIPSLFAYLQTKFDSINVVAATGRHYALVATMNRPQEDGKNREKRGIITDLRFNDDGSYRLKDTHLKAWQSKEE